MEKKRLLVIGIVLALITAALGALFLFPKDEIPAKVLNQIEEIELSAALEGIHTTTSFYPRYTGAKADLFFQYDHCGDVIRNTVAKFSNINIEKSEKRTKVRELEKTEIDSAQLPLIVMKGSAEIFDLRNNFVSRSDEYTYAINGKTACSEKLLTSFLCTIVSDKPSFCGNATVKRKPKTITSLNPRDALCYETCIAEAVVDGVLVTQYRGGPPCNAKPGFSEGKAKLIERNCEKASCKSDNEDIACCLATQCVYGGTCYNTFDRLDIDKDNNFEICMIVDEAGFWIDADSTEDICVASSFSWLTCEADSCEHGYDTFDSKENGFCCGDDENEQETTCNGAICKTQQISGLSCCAENSCSYNGECYNPGCATITLESEEEVTVYCHEGKWTDLDEDFCPVCMGENAWSGLICCGDDHEEGKYPTRFVYNDGTADNVVFYDYCTNDKSSCVLPNTDSEFIEGCYFFDDNEFLDDGYYCKDSEWVDLDNSSSLCNKCGFEWTETCCGDDTSEFFIEGDDGTSACCNVDTDVVANGRCISTLNCGNGALEPGEQCEGPYSENNQLCPQSETKCFDNRLGTRDQYADCGRACTCLEDSYKIACTAGACGAECGQDSDCPDGSVCDLNNCGCRLKTFCGDGIRQEVNDDNWNEACEAPDTLFNPHCDEQVQCFDTKTGVRYDFGSCDSNCQCQYERFHKMCVKGSCHATCNQDGSGCPEGSICDLDSCSCISSTAVCGNDICEIGEEFICSEDCQSLACPARIDIEFDKNSYQVNETLSFEVTIYDGFGNVMPEVLFEVDVVVNGNLISTNSYATADSGTYRQKRIVQQSLISGSYEYVAHIAKAFEEECGFVSDSDTAFISTLGSFQSQTNLSRFEFFTFNYNSTSASCGNGEIEPGEACEGNTLCRLSQKCDYKDRTYDVPEFCSSCSCPVDWKSDPDDEIYCENCVEHCGDGVVNCGEECEAGIEEKGLTCKEGKLYNAIDACNSCLWEDDGLQNDVLISDCFCECPADPGECNQGNWVEYESSFAAGCQDGKCNECACRDTYTKDSNNDGIEDKCTEEVCTNGIDDNDNGLIDLDDPACSLCQHCGFGTFNICDQSECNSFLEGCFFESTFIGGSCCKDSDQDEICDSIDNCPKVFNPDQIDSDLDTFGDACDICKFEPLLTNPLEETELSCVDNIDNDCDGVADCKDSDCTGIADCCMETADCRGGSCTKESCVNNHCQYVKRTLCDNEECAEDEYCNLNGECASAEESSDVCVSCVEDKTPDDHGIAYNSSYEISACCGNNNEEFFIQARDLNQGACCDNLTDCVDANGQCVDSNTSNDDVHSVHCSINTWYQCDNDFNVICAEAGAGYKVDATYLSSGETGWICTYDETWAFRNTLPDEICYDFIDNDCDHLIDEEDSDCR